MEIHVGVDGEVKKYKKLQIIKHALQHYINRSEANENDVRTEKLLLQEITDEVEELKQQYGIK